MRMIAMAAVLLANLVLTGGCDRGKRQEPPSVGIGQRIQVPESDFSVVVQNGEVADSLSGNRPKAAGARWVIIKFLIKNEAAEPRDSLLELHETLRTRSGAVYEASADGMIGLLMEDPGWSEGGLDRVPAGKEVKQVKVFPVPAEQARGEVVLVLEKWGKTGPPHAIGIAVPLTERPRTSAPAPASATGASAPSR